MLLQAIGGLVHLLPSIYTASRTPPPLCCTASSSICSAASWPSLQEELDELPVFVLANSAGEPLQHQQTPDAPPMMVCFADLFRAEAELANANRLYPDAGLELLPVGLGDAYKRMEEGSAMIVPSQNELTAAALDESAAASNLVPLFGCTKLMKPRKTNPDVQAMPLFFSSSDARAALDTALSGFAVPEGMKAEAVGLDILCIPLQKAVELVVTGKETRFEFYAPSKSIEWVQKYAEKQRQAAKGQEGGGKGGASEGEVGSGDEGDEAAQKQAMFETLIDQRQQILKNTGGVIPGQTPRESESAE